MSGSKFERTRAFSSTETEIASRECNVLFHPTYCPIGREGVHGKNNKHPAANPDFPKIRTVNFHDSPAKELSIFGTAVSRSSLLCLPDAASAPATFPGVAIKNYISAETFLGLAESRLLCSSPEMYAKLAASSPIFRVLSAKILFSSRLPPEELHFRGNFRKLHGNENSM